MYVGESGITTEIVGLVGNVLKGGHDRAPEPEIYFAHGSPTRSLRGYFSIAVRTSGEPAALADTLREAAREADNAAALVRVEPLSDQVAASMAQPRFATMTLTLFAALAVSLASVGLFAVLSYTVSLRRRELGVRAALGASRTGLLRLVLVKGMTVTGIGLLLGLLASAALTRLLQGLLFGVTPLDAMSFALAPLILLPAAMAASLLPAYRAACTDPALVLRGD